MTRSNSKTEQTKAPDAEDKQLERQVALPMDEQPVYRITDTFDFHQSRVDQPVAPMPPVADFGGSEDRDTDGFWEGVDWLANEVLDLGEKLYDIYG
ncbi:MAG: hypothetical protein AAFV49_03900 [Pseudomonadota bacterium]